MSNLEAFKQFAKRGKYSPAAQAIKNAVIYTRVSSKEQAETNKSLETQGKYCREYAQKNSINVLEQFGGTYESAQTDERKEFKRMLQFVRTNKEPIDYVIVYSVDRFSRSGEGAISILSELSNIGVKLLPVTQPTDASTPSGKLQQNMLLLFSQFDNDLRRQKCVAGMIEKLRRGEWSWRAPIGYNQITINGEQKITVNEKGEILRKAFFMKANEGLSNAEIIKRCKALGLVIAKQRLTEIFKNPFYAGLIVHSLADGEIIRGKQEAVVSEAIFLKANGQAALNPHGFTQNIMNESLPLKRFTKCAECGTPMTGYINRKKKIYYYRCNKKGCNCNVNAKIMKEAFEEQIAQHSIDTTLIEPLKEQLSLTFSYLNRQNESNRNAIQTRLAELRGKINKVEEKFVIGDINKELYEKYIGRFKEEEREIQGELKKVDFNLSNLPKYVKFSVDISSSLNKMWHSGDYIFKQKLQYMIYPDGMTYSKMEGKYLTPRVNYVFSELTRLSNSLKEKESGLMVESTNSSALVGPVGLEPTANGL